MEVINNFSATVYYRQNLEGDDQTKLFGIDENYDEIETDHGQ